MQHTAAWTLLLAVGLVTACGESPTVEQPVTLAGLSGSTPASVDEDAVTERAVETVADQTFHDTGDVAQCTDDCSGHDAGFEWAKEEGVTDASECDGRSQSFVEGCEAYAEAVEAAQDDAREELEEEATE